MQSVRCIQPSDTTFRIDRTWDVLGPDVIQGPAFLPIGQMLREARESRGLSIEVVSDALFVTKSVVSALEAGKWTILPHWVYVKGYIKSYASILGIGNIVVECLRKHDEAAAGDGKAQTDKGAEYRPERRTDTRISIPGNRAKSLPGKLLAICSSVITLLIGMALCPALQPQSCPGMKEGVYLVSHPTTDMHGVTPRLSPPEGQERP
jgi:transcriptional regulator with XRE-family HTH domain